jgi:hypothetical protein
MINCSSGRGVLQKALEALRSIGYIYAAYSIAVSIIALLIIGIRHRRVDRYVKKPLESIRVNIDLEEGYQLAAGTSTHKARKS